MVTSDREWITWLLNFMQSNIDDLSYGELIDMRDSALRFPKNPVPLSEPDQARMLGLAASGDPFWAEVNFEPPLVFAGDADKVRAAAIALLSEVQRSLRDGLAATQTEFGYWAVFSQDLPAPGWVVELLADGSLRRRFSGAFGAVFLACSANLLVRWWPKLRRCHYESCRALFLPRDGRQCYHVPACSAKRRQERFWEGRDRNYNAEYEKRVKREFGPGATPQHRNKKTGAK